MEELITNAVNQLNNLGYFKTNIKNIGNRSNIELFNKNITFLNSMISDPKIQKEIDLINTNPLQRPGTKPFEINQFHYLGRALGLNDGAFIKLYLDDFFTRVASQFLNCNDPKIFNILTWIHVWNGKFKRQHSQNWHRDREDYKILKIFIYYSDVGPKNGPFEYVPKSFCGGDFYDLYKGRNSYDDYTPDEFNSGKPKSMHEIQRCEESFISFTGQPGDIIMVNNSGFHRGGYVENGVRVITHALYLRPDAYMIKHQNYFTSFNYSPSDVNYVDFNSPEFGALGYKTKFFKEI